MAAERAPEELLPHCLVLWYPDQSSLNVSNQKRDCVNDSVDRESPSIVRNVFDYSNPQIFGFLRIKFDVLLVIIQHD